MVALEVLKARIAYTVCRVPALTRLLNEPPTPTSRPHMMTTHSGRKSGPPINRRAVLSCPTTHRQAPFSTPFPPLFDAPANLLSNSAAYVCACGVKALLSLVVCVCAPPPAHTERIGNTRHARVCTHTHARTPWRSCVFGMLSLAYHSLYYALGPVGEGRGERERANH